MYANADALSQSTCRQYGRENHHSLVPVLVAATIMWQPQHAPSERLHDSQLADSMLGPILCPKETGKKQTNPPATATDAELVVCNRICHQV